MSEPSKSKQERQALRELLTQSYQNQVTETQSKLLRMGLNQDSYQWTQEMYKLHSQHQSSMNKIDAADEREEDNEENRWKYEGWHNKPNRFWGKEE